MRCMYGEAPVYRRADDDSGAPTATDGALLSPVDHKHVANTIDGARTTRTPIFPSDGRAGEL